MAAQVNAPVVVLTRPAAQSRRFAAALRRMVPGLRVMVAPLMEEVALDADLPDLPGVTVIFSSETGVRAAARLVPPGARGQALCVGPRTTAVARRAGWDARMAGAEAEALVAALSHPGPPCLHLRGAEARGNIAARLTAAGRPTAEAIVYRQDPRPLPPRALALLGGAAPVLVPVLVPIFSPRSARLLRAAAPEVGPQVTLAALSPAVAEALRGMASAHQKVRLAARPDGAAMQDVIAAWAAEVRMRSLSPLGAGRLTGAAKESNDDRH